MLAEELGHAMGSVRPVGHQDAVRCPAGRVIRARHEDRHGRETPPERSALRAGGGILIGSWQMVTGDGDQGWLPILRSMSARRAARSVPASASRVRAPLRGWSSIPTSTCPEDICRWPCREACLSAPASVCLVSSPSGSRLRPGTGARSRAPGPKAASVARRTWSRSIPRDARAPGSRSPSGAAWPPRGRRDLSSASVSPAADRASAALPGSASKPISTCSLWILSWPARPASTRASAIACRAAGSNRSNIVCSGLLAAGQAAAHGLGGPAGRRARVLLVHGLLADAEENRDLLPGPAPVACVLDLEGL